MQNLKLFMAVTALSFIFWSCSNETFEEESINNFDTESYSFNEKNPIDLNEISSILKMAADIEKGTSNQRKGGQMVVIPAGSTNALENAVNSAGKGGTIVLKAGLHTESNTVNIAHTVKIIGETGAVLQVDTKPDVSGTAPFKIEPAIHILNADKTLIWGITLRPPSGQIGGTGILIQNSQKVTIAQNEISEHQICILVEQSDEANMWNNTVNADAGWNPDNGYFTQGIIVVNGERNKIVGNEINNGFLGIWACDKNSKFLNNTIEKCYFGMLLCKVQADNYELPDGSIIGAEFSGTNWLVANNEANDNFFGGYVVIDGANNNLLVNNAASNNASYDIEIVGDSFRFGFLTPSSFDNTIITGSHNDIIVKDCGINSTIKGGNLVDTTFDPCF